MNANCELCKQPGGEELWRDLRCRVILVDDAVYPGFCRVIWNDHIKEMTDLDAAERDHLMHIVFAVESALKTTLKPDKINLAEFGNVVPHLHWHVIPRYVDDVHFPNPIWGEKQRDAVTREGMSASSPLRETLTAEIVKLCTIAAAQNQRMHK